MKLRCASCASNKKNRTATLLHEGDSLCQECYEKKLELARAARENADRMRAIEARLAELASTGKK